MKRNLIKDLNVINKNLYFKDPFYSLFSASIRKVEREDIPLAAVGLNKSTMDVTLFINPKEWYKLDNKNNAVYSNDMKEAIILHELSHLTHFHLLNDDQYPNKRMANIAMD